MTKNHIDATFFVIGRRCLLFSFIHNVCLVFSNFSSALVPGSFHCMMLVLRPVVGHLIGIVSLGFSCFNCCFCVNFILYVEDLILNFGAN